MKPTVFLALPLVFAAAAHAQGRGGADWTTTGNDAQRSFWVRADPKINLDSMQKPGFQFLWKVKLASAPSAPVLLDRYIGYRGFRSLGFAGTGGGTIFALDTDLGKIEWQMQLKGAAAQPASAACPGGMTSGLTRPTSTALASAGGGGGGGRGRGGPATSGVGQPGQGAVTLANAPGGGRAAAPPGAPDAPGGRRGGGFGGGRQPAFVHALTSDGMFHTMYVSNGVEPQPPAQFLPANANAQGLIVVDEVAYVATSGRCGGAPDGLWALDMATKQVASWKPGSGGIAGTAGPAFGPDGTVYVTTTTGELAALEAKTLKLKNLYPTDKVEFTSSPVVFEHGGKVLLAATTKNGRLRLWDAASPDARMPQSPVDPNSAPGALATWQDSAGTRWLLVPAADVVIAWKVTEQGGSRSLVSGWTSREMASTTTPMIVNGVVFTVSGGGPKRTAKAVLYAYDGMTGKELWNSGSTIASYIQGGGLSSGSGQMYVGTYDGMLYGFGYPIEH